VPKHLTIGGLIALLDGLGRTYGYSLEVYFPTMEQGDWPEEFVVTGAEFRRTELTPSETLVPDRIRLMGERL